MLFHIRMVDYPVSRRTADSREKHWRYLEERADIILGRGPTQDDDGRSIRSSLFFIDAPNRAAAERFVAEEPHFKAGCFMSIEIFRWNNVLGRRQQQFPRIDGQVFWYLRGYAKPDADVRRALLLDQHKAYFEPHDSDKFILRGSVQTDEGRWIGSANLIALPDRKSVDLFASKEPFCKNGLFERMVIERFKFGGRPEERGP